MIDWTPFKKMDADEWMTKVDADLNGKKLASEFIHNIEGDFIVSPFLTDAPKYPNLALPNQTKAAIFIETEDSEVANEKALKYLNLGVEILIFISQSGYTDLMRIFRNVHLEMISVLFLIKENDHKFEVQLAYYLTTQYPNKKVDVSIHLQDENIISQDLTYKNRLIKFGKKARSIENTGKNIVQLELKRDFFGQIAELRAMRNIWALAGNDANDLFILAIVKDENIENASVHPLTISNFKLMSAYMGMSDTAVVISDPNNEEQIRLNLNIQHIFREESSLQSVSDPFLGAYIIEALTDQMTNIVS